MEATTARMPNPMNGAPKVTSVFNDGPLGLGDILDDAIGSRTDASDRADQIIAESITNDGAFSTVRTDSSGTPFDAAIHEHDSGIPRTSADGRFRRKRGRKSGVDYSATNSGNSIEPESGNALARGEAVKQAKTTTALIFTVGQGLFGAEWKPMSKAETGGFDEKDFLADKIADYYEARGCVELPPEIGLILAIGAIVGPRLCLPQTQSKLNRWGGGAWKKIKSWCGYDTDETGIELTDENLKG